MTPNTPKASPTRAQRMRQYRKRRRRGFRCIHLPLHVTEIDDLIERKLLKEDERDNPLALKRAVCDLISRALADQA
jgi:hypothetical protein